MSFLEALSVIVGGLGFLAGVIAFFRAQTAENASDRALAQAEESSARTIGIAEGATRKAAESARLAQAAGQTADRALRQAAEANALSSDAAGKVADALAQSAAAVAQSAEALAQATEAAQRSASHEQPASREIVHTGDDDLAVVVVPPDGDVRWECEQVKKTIWVARNTGSATARSALLSDATRPPKYVRPDEVIPRDVPPGDHLQFRAFLDGGVRAPRVKVAWSEDGVTKSQEITLVFN